MSRVLKLLFIISLFFSVYSSVLAVDFTISNVPTTITDQPFSFDVSISGASPGTNYLRTNFYLLSSTTYSGYTFNGTDFYNGSTYSQYLPITISSSGNWQGTMQAKIDTNEINSSGTYGFRVRRYTSASYYTWSNEVSLTVNLPVTPTPTPTITPTPSLTPTPTLTPTSTPTNTPTPSKTPTPTKIPSLTPTPTPTSQPPTPSPTSKSSLSNQTTETNPLDIEIPQSIKASSVLGTTSTPSSSLSTSSATSKSSSNFNFSQILIAAGILVLMLGGVLIATFVAQKRSPQV